MDFGVKLAVGLEATAQAAINEDSWERKMKADTEIYHEINYPELFMESFCIVGK